MDREEIMQAITNHLESNIKELNTSMEGYRAGSDLDEGDTKDLEDFSQQSEQKEMFYQMQIQLDNAQAVLNRLQEFPEERFDIAKPGALIKTDKNWFLLGISLPSIDIGNTELLGVSTETPAYNVIHGKSKGESFKLGDATYKVLGIY